MTAPPDKDELTILVNTISHRVAGFLERQGLPERDEENSYLQLEGLEEAPMQQLIGHSVTRSGRSPAGSKGVYAADPTSTG